MTSATDRICLAGHSVFNFLPDFHLACAPAYTKHSWHGKISAQLQSYLLATHFYDELSPDFFLCSLLLLLWRKLSESATIALGSVLDTKKSFSVSCARSICDMRSHYLEKNDDNDDDDDALHALGNASPRDHLSCYLMHYVSYLLKY